MKDKLSFLLIRARYILQTEGLIPLLRRGFTWLAMHLFKYSILYLYECPVREGNLFDFIPRIPGYSFSIVSTNQPADVLAANELQKHVSNAKRRLDSGAIAFCIFAGQELASVHWAALTQEAKNVIDPYPYHIDFLNGEACLAYAFTPPKYRGKGLIAYGICESFQFLRERGITTARFSTDVSTTMAQSLYAKFDSRIYAEARYFKVLWWQFWKETPISPTP